MKSNIISCYVAKQVLLQFFAVLSLMLLLIYCWNLVAIMHGNISDSWHIFIGVGIKAIARLHQIIPVSLVLAIISQVLLLLHSKQLLAMRLFGYKFIQVLLPALLVTFSIAIAIALVEQNYKSDLMLKTYANFCQSGYSRFCAQDKNIWEINNKYVINLHIKPDTQQILSAKVITFNPNRVYWYGALTFKNGHWFSGLELLPIKLRPTELKYAALMPKDQPSKLMIDNNLIISIIVSCLFVFYIWFYFVDSS